MTNTMFQLNYDLLEPIAKSFKDEGVDMIQLHSSTRKRVQDIQKEWIGEAAEKFFEEMQSELLPALQRLAYALFHSQDAASDVMKIIQEADQETVGYFDDQLSGDDFSAGMFDQALEGLSGGNSASDDFGEALKDTTPPPDDPGSGKSEDNKQAMDSEQQKGESQQQRSEQSEENSKGGQSETETTPAGGGGGSSTPSQGLQGDLKNMGAGMFDQAPQSTTANNGATRGNMPDHLYSSGVSTPSGDTSEPVTSSGSDTSAQSSSTGDGSIVAGAAGIAATVAAIGKVIKEIKDREENK